MTPGIWHNGCCCGACSSSASFADQMIGTYGWDPVPSVAALMEGTFFHVADSDCGGNAANDGLYQEGVGICVVTFAAPVTVTSKVWGDLRNVPLEGITTWPQTHIATIRWRTEFSAWSEVVQIQTASDGEACCDTAYHEDEDTARAFGAGTYWFEFFSTTVMPEPYTYECMVDTHVHFEVAWTAVEGKNPLAGGAPAGGHYDLFSKRIARCRQCQEYKGNKCGEYPGKSCRWRRYINMRGAICPLGSW